MATFYYADEKVGNKKPIDRNLSGAKYIMHLGMKAEIHQLALQGEV